MDDRANVIGVERTLERPRVANIANHQRPPTDGIGMASGQVVEADRQEARTAERLAGM